MIEIINDTRKVKSRKIHNCSYCNGQIAIGEIYNRTKLKYDYIYTWKSHLKCSEIADKLKMYDNDGEGLTHEDFCESIKEEFRQIWMKKSIDYFESKEFIIPKFKEQLEFVYNEKCI